MSVTALTASHTQPRPQAIEKPPAVRSNEESRVKEASHRDEKVTAPVRPAAATSSSGVQSALVSLKKGG